jgi:hypothetical protein
LYFSSGYEPSPAKPPALKQLRNSPLLSASLQLLFTAVAAATARATRQQPQFSQPHCLLSLSEATHKMSNDFKITLLKGKDNYAIWLIDIRAILRSKKYWNSSLSNGDAEVATAAAVQL